MYYLTVKLLKIINLTCAGITAILCFLFFKENYELLYKTDEVLYAVQFDMYLFSQLLLFAYGVIISLKANGKKGNLLMALFLIIMCQNGLLSYLVPKVYVESDYFMALHSILVVTVFINATRYFPEHLSFTAVRTIFGRRNWIGKIVNLTLKKKAWYILPMIAVAFNFLVNVPFFHNALWSLIMLSMAALAILNLYVNFKNAEPAGRNKILLLFWGGFLWCFLNLLYFVVKYFGHDSNYFVYCITSILESISVISAFTLSLFFFNTFDTGILVKRTLVDSICFLAIVIVYNTAEHYALHRISEALDLSDALTSSFFSGILVMAINPLHHKLMHFMKGLLTKQHDHSITETV